MDESIDIIESRGRGAVSNQTGRFEKARRSLFDDGWNTVDTAPKQLSTEVHLETPRAIITRNTSPDVPFEQSLNAYRGCEHGCVYCFARPSHAYMGLSAGLDFETQLFAKPNAASLLEKEITRPGYVPKTIALGTNTDPYQPIERQLRLTRQILEVLERHTHPVSIVTKSDRILDDLELIARLAKKGLVSVGISITTLDRKLARTLEPRAATPARRLAAMEALAAKGVPVTVMMAPVIPALTDHEIERILAAAANAGAHHAAWVMLRLPGEVAPLFSQWLGRHAPDKKARVLGHLRAMRDGKLNDPRFGHRMRGAGPYADLIQRRFTLAAKRHGLKVATREVADPFKRSAIATSVLSLPKTRQTAPQQLSLF
ncbi:MAG: PA0069 family radical SAM protein [Sphingomonadales bacterium]